MCVCVCADGQEIFGKLFLEAFVSPFLFLFKVENPCMGGVFRVWSLSGDGVARAGIAWGGDVVVGIGWTVGRWLGSSGQSVQRDCNGRLLSLYWSNWTQGRAPQVFRNSVYVRLLADITSTMLVWNVWNFNSFRR